MGRPKAEISDMKPKYHKPYICGPCADGEHYLHAEGFSDFISGREYGIPVYVPFKVCECSECDEERKQH